MSLEFKDKLNKEASYLNLEINEEKLEKFFEYMTLLLEWNKKFNLTSITNEDEIIIKHFIDSLTVVKYIKNNDRIVDIGTGAGFPGIPLAIMLENNITLVDSLNKRINFLNVVKEKLNLTNVEIFHYRAEDFGQNKKFREKYDISLSRAVANLSVLVEYLIPLTKVDGKVICMKGPDISEEINDAKYAINLLGGKISKIDKFTLNETDIQRSICVINKISKTPNFYPRKAGLPSKKPLVK